MSATCSACHAPIRWAKSAVSGKPAPFDATPSPVAGNARILDNGTVEVLGGFSLEEARRYKERLYVSHFATCPDAAKFRARKP